MNALAALEIAVPAKALFLDACTLRLRTDKPGITGTVALAESVAAGDQSDGLLVIHRHAGECLADVAGRGHRVRLAVRAFRIDVDQTHLHGGKRISSSRSPV